MNELEKEFAPYQEALALKELGFDEFCFGYFRDGKLSGVNKWDRNDWEFHVISNKDITNITHEIVLAPTYSQAFRFFREKYGLIGWVEGKRFYKFCIESFIPTDDQLNLSPFPTYEVAELACLKKLIEIVKLDYLSS